MRASRRKRGSKRVQVGLRQAARMTGRNQSTVHRAMRTGWLSFTVNEAGERRIDVAELERVFGIKSPPGEAVAVINGASSEAVAQAVASNATHAGEIVALERLLAEREASIARQDETIRDLRARLDDAGDALRRSAEERRQLIALLTDQRTRPWWRRWFR